MRYASSSRDLHPANGLWYIRQKPYEAGKAHVVEGCFYSTDTQAWKRYKELMLTAETAWVCAVGYEDQGN